jgi:branched-chain amino acid transport system ATP-binding protein
MFLEIRDLHVAYGDIQAVRGVSFHLEEGELVSIIGVNGAGKSSVLQSVMGLLPCQAGKIIYKGHDITGLPAHEKAKLGIRMVPERSRIFPRLTVYENLMIGLYRLRNRFNVEQRLAHLYQLFPVLAERRQQLGHTLSGGEQQQLAIARALISGPELLLLDEVSMGLMPKLVDEVFSLLRKLNCEQRLTMLLVEQNAVASLSISSRAYVLETGTVALHGSAQELMQNRRVQEVYLGHN